MEKRKTILEDYKKLLGLAATKWKDHMLFLLEEDTYNIDVKDTIDLPFPMQDGKTKLDPGQYQVELSPDKTNYIWTNPSTQERVVFPVDLINKPEESPPEGEDGQLELPGADVGSQEVNPFAPQDLGFPAPPEQQI